LKTEHDVNQSKRQHIRCEL